MESLDHPHRKFSGAFKVVSAVYANFYVYKFFMNYLNYVYWIIQIGMHVD